MLTIVFYNFILLVSTFLVYLGGLGKNSLSRNCLFFLAFLVVFLPAALRYDIGVDFLSYVDIYENLSSYTWMEPGFYFVNWLFKSIKADSQWVLATFAFIFSAVAFKSYPKKNAWLIHFLFIALLWFPSLNGVRQAISNAFCLLAIFYFFEEKTAKFFIFIFVAALFHASAIVISLVGVLALIPMPYRFMVRVVPTLFVVTICLTAVSASYFLIVIEAVLDVLGMNNYLRYFDGGRHFESPESGSGISVYVRVLFCIYMIANAKPLLDVNRKFIILLVLIFLYAVGLLLANEIIIFGRMASIFVIGPIVGAYFIFQLPGKNKINQLVVLLFLLFLYIYFNRIAMGTETSYTNPKLNPYQSILSAF